MSLRQAVRGLARTPGFSIVVVSTLALGIAATTAMFTVVNGVRLRPLPFHDPGRLYLAETHISAPDAQAMQALVSDAAAVRRFQTGVVGVFAAAGLGIAALGLYGLVAFAVLRRTREIGVRAALGATRGRILGMMLAQGLRPVAIGTAIGIATALVAGNILASQLYGVTAQDPRVLAAVAATLSLVALAACWIPARRATRVDPMITLRAE